LADVINNKIPHEVLAAHRPGKPFPYSDNPPNLKIIISIREDYLGYLEEMSGDIPRILDNRFRLLPLSREEKMGTVKKNSISMISVAKLYDQVTIVGTGQSPVRIG
jgi:hypothetical protein